MAEGSGLLNRRTGSTRTVSSNLIPSARPASMQTSLSRTAIFSFQFRTAPTTAPTEMPPPGSAGPWSSGSGQDVPRRCRPPAYRYAPEGSRPVTTMKWPAQGA